MKRISLFIILSLTYLGVKQLSASATLTYKPTKLWVKRDYIEQTVRDQLNPLLTVEHVKAVIKQESSWNPTAINDDSNNYLYHSYGLMQVSKAKAIDYGIDPSDLLDPEWAILIGTRILSNCFSQEASYLPKNRRTPYDPTLLTNAFTCYNVGEAWRSKPISVINKGRVYARKVINHMRNV